MSAPFPARFPGECDDCGGHIGPGDLIAATARPVAGRRSRFVHASCPDVIDSPAHDKTQAA